MMKLLLTNLNILLKSDLNKTIVEKFKCFIKIKLL
jgi:hypothetical protein